MQMLPEQMQPRDGRPDAGGRRKVVRAFVRTGVALVVCLLLVRCDFGATEDVEPQLVVEAFLVTGEPLPPITLRQTRPTTSPTPTDDSVDAATGAEVVLTIDGRTVPYAEDAGQPGRYRPTVAGVVVEHGMRFDLEVQWSGLQAEAQGMAPPPVVIDSIRLDVPDKAIEAILVDSLRRDSLDIPAEQGFIYPIEATLHWTTDFPAVGPDSAYWMRTRLRPRTSISSTVLDFFLQPEEVLREREFPGPEPRHRWTGVYAVGVSGEDDPLPVHRLTLALIRSDADYASYAASRNDPDRREPNSNVQGGLGIATIIAIDSIQIQLGVNPDLP